MLGYYTSVILLCWLTLGILCVLVGENNRIPVEDKRLLYLTYGLIAISSLAELCGVLLNGRMGVPRWTLRLAKCADYILTPMAGGALVAQLHLRNRWHRLMLGILAVNGVFQLAAVPLGWTLVIDEANVYSHGPLFPAYIAVCLAIIVLMIVQFVTYSRSFRKRNRTSLYNIMLLVILAVVIQEVPEGYRTAYLGMSIGAALMFIHHSEFYQLAVDDTLKEQRIQIMLSQIKPHFLYNALGSIEALCDRDPAKAKQATRKFSKYLRGNMNSLTEESMIPFENELQHTQLYLELEQIRFGEALRVEYDVAARDFKIPPLTLEPIVENAVKHGIRANPDGRGTVSIVTEEYWDRYVVRVTDDGPGFDPRAIPNDGETHVGIRNVRERLQRICSGSLRIEPAPGRGSVVTILLPKRRRA